MTRSFNDRLAPLPDDITVLRAIAELEPRAKSMGVTANDVAHKLGIEPASRAGRGAVKGSWSGRMSPALRIAPRLERLHRLGWIISGYGYRSRKHWYLTPAGRQELES